MAAAGRWHRDRCLCLVLLLLAYPFPRTGIDADELGFWVTNQYRTHHVRCDQLRDIGFRGVNQEDRHTVYHRLVLHKEQKHRGVCARGQPGSGWAGRQRPQHASRHARPVHRRRNRNRPVTQTADNAFPPAVVCARSDKAASPTGSWASRRTPATRSEGPSIRRDTAGLGSLASLSSLHGPAPLTSTFAPRQQTALSRSPSRWLTDARGRVPAGRRWATCCQDA